MIRNFYRCIIAVISTFSVKMASKLYYFTKIHKGLNLKNPRTFNEKLMYLKINEYQDNELITKCADKYKVREYVNEAGCPELLNELIDVYDNVDEIDFSKLPNQFVLKCNHAAGYNIICRDKKTINEQKIKKQLKKWIKTDYWKFVAEVQYKNIEKKIVCEKFLDSGNGRAIEDYKIYCFNGKPEFCMVCIGRELGKPKYYFVDKDWKIMKINNLGIKTPDNYYIEKPKCIDKMYMYAEKLSKPFKFVRVDFYNYNGKPIFGELTFTPAACVDNNYTKEGQILLGNMLNLEEE